MGSYQTAHLRKKGLGLKLQKKLAGRAEQRKKTCESSFAHYCIKPHDCVVHWCRVGSVTFLNGAATVSAWLGDADGGVSRLRDADDASANDASADDGWSSWANDSVPDDADDVSWADGTPNGSDDGADGHRTKARARSAEPANPAHRQHTKGQRRDEGKRKGIPAIPDGWTGEQN